MRCKDTTFFANDRGLPKKKRAEPTFSEELRGKRLELRPFITR